MKNTPSFLIFLLPAHFLFSQNFSVGIFGGINAAFQQYKHETSPFIGGPQESKPGHVVGGTLICHLTECLTLRTGLNWERKGGAESFTFTDENGYPTGESTLKTNLDYVQIPLLVEVSFLPNQILFVNAGYGFGFFQRAKHKTGNNLISTGNNIADQYEAMDYSFIAGLGTKVPFSEKMAFTFEGRWQSGLNDVRRPVAETAKNRSVFAALGLRFHL